MKSIRLYKQFWLCKLKIHYWTKYERGRSKDEDGYEYGPTRIERVCHRCGRYEVKGNLGT